MLISSTFYIFLFQPLLPSGECEYTTFGCCKDGVSVASGPGYEGCRSNSECLSTPHGCCPDGVTAASAPGHGGCPSIVHVGGRYMVLIMLINTYLIWDIVLIMSVKCAKFANCLMNYYYVVFFHFTVIEP